jgi:acetyl esterase
MLIYPVTDAAMDTPSQQEFINDGFVLSKLDMEWFWGYYLKTPKDGENPYASPLRAKDLKNLPPAHIITASHDPLRDEGEAYGELLRKAGNQVKVKRYEGVVHGFFSLQAVLDQGKAATRDLAAELNAAWK